MKLMVDYSTQLLVHTKDDAVTSGSGVIVSNPDNGVQYYATTGQLLN